MIFKEPVQISVGYKKIYRYLLQAVDIHKMSAAFFIAQKGFLRFV
jgi:hypothetical protein